MPVFISTFLQHFMCVCNRTSADTSLDDNVANITFIVIVETDLILEGYAVMYHCNSAICLVQTVSSFLTSSS